MPYYAKIARTMMTIATERGQVERPVGEQLLDFVYYNPIKLNDQLDRLFSLCAHVKDIDPAEIISQTDEQNSYLRFYSELLIDTLADGGWSTKQGFSQLCKQYPQETAFLRDHPHFAKTTYKTAGKAFLIGIFSAHAMKMQDFLKSQLAFCMDSTSDQALKELTPTQRLYLYEQWRKSKGELPVYFETETYSSRMVIDRPVVFPAGGSLGDWAEVLKKENPVITEMTELPNGYALMRYEMMHMVMQNVHIKLCANCGRYFINTGRSDKEYCSRPTEAQPDKTCETVGALLKFQKKSENSALMKEFNTAYKRANSSKRIGNLSEQEFKAWSKQAREKRDLCLDGKLSQEELIAWLNKDRIYKKRG